MDGLIEQMRDMQLASGAARVASATGVGQTLMSKCPVARLVMVSDSGRAEANAWLARAGPDGDAVREASKSTSCVPEKSSIQPLVTKLLLTQPRTQAGSLCAYKLHDKHTEASVCGTLKPYGVVSAGEGEPLPSSTALVLELKGQDGSYNSPAHMLQVRLKSEPALLHIAAGVWFRVYAKCVGSSLLYNMLQALLRPFLIHHLLVSQQRVWRAACPLALLQLSSYGVELLRQLPQTYRNSVLLGITDLRRITFLRITRYAEDDFRYERSEETDEVLAALCSVLEMTPQQVCFEVFEVTLADGVGVGGGRRTHCHGASRTGPQLSADVRFRTLCTLRSCQPMPGFMVAYCMQLLTRCLHTNMNAVARNLAASAEIQGCVAATAKAAGRWCHLRRLQELTQRRGRGHQGAAARFHG